MAVTPQPGDVVLAANEETGEIGYKEVLDTFRNETNVVVHVTVNDETFTCTEEHPFYVEGKGWVNASALRVGMVVWLADGTKAIIQDVWVEYLVEAVAVFNFKVEDFHTYFIGYSGVLVHNANCGTTTNQKGQTVQQDPDGKWRDTTTGQYAEGPDGPAINSASSGNSQPEQLVKGRENEKTILDWLGLDKNTETVGGGRIQDAKWPDGTWVEIKDRKNVYNTAQMQEFTSADATDLFVTPGAHVSDTLVNSITESGGGVYIIDPATGYITGY